MHCNAGTEIPVPMQLILYGYGKWDSRVGGCKNLYKNMNQILTNLIKVTERFNLPVKESYISSCNQRSGGNMETLNAMFLFPS